MKGWKWSLVFKVAAVAWLILSLVFALLEVLRIPQNNYYSFSVYAPDFTWYPFFSTLFMALLSGLILYNVGVAVGYLEKLYKARQPAFDEDGSAEDNAGETTDHVQMPVSDVEALFGTHFIPMDR